MVKTVMKAMKAMKVAKAMKSAKKQKSLREALFGKDKGRAMKAMKSIKASKQDDTAGKPRRTEVVNGPVSRIRQPLFPHAFGLSFEGTVAQACD